MSSAPLDLSEPVLAHGVQDYEIRKYEPYLVSRTGPQAQHSKRRKLRTRALEARAGLQAGT